MGNTPVRSLTEEMEKTERRCATTRVYYRNSRAGCSSEQRHPRNRNTAYSRLHICTVSAFGREGTFLSMIWIFSVKCEPASVAGIQVTEERTGHGAVILGSWRMTVLGNGVVGLSRCLQCALPNLNWERQLRAFPCHV